MKKIYLCPLTKTTHISTGEGLLKVISLPKSSHSASGGGDAKQGFLLEDESDGMFECVNPWEDQ